MSNPIGKINTCDIKQVVRRNRLNLKTRVLQPPKEQATKQHDLSENTGTNEVMNELDIHNKVKFKQDREQNFDTFCQMKWLEV